MRKPSRNRMNELQSLLNEFLAEGKLHEQCKVAEEHTMQNVFNAQPPPRSKRCLPSDPVLLAAELERKRQRNTESARRSRMRKTLRLQSLQKRLDELTQENNYLKGIVECYLNHFEERIASLEKSSLGKQMNDWFEWYKVEAEAPLTLSSNMPVVNLPSLPPITHMIDSCTAPMYH